MYSLLSSLCIMFLHQPPWLTPRGHQQDQSSACPDQMSCLTAITKWPPHCSPPWECGSRRQPLLGTLAPSGGCTWRQCVAVVRTVQPWVAIRLSKVSTCLPNCSEPWPGMVLLNTEIKDKLFKFSMFRFPTLKCLGLNPCKLLWKAPVCLCYI